MKVRLLPSERARRRRERTQICCANCGSRRRACSSMEEHHPCKVADVSSNLTRSTRARRRRQRRQICSANCGSTAGSPTVPKLNRHKRPVETRENEVRFLGVPQAFVRHLGSERLAAKPVDAQTRSRTVQAPL